MYEIVETLDGKSGWGKIYEDCLEAVRDYDKFEDSGNARFERIITLTDINSGKIYTKRYICYTMTEKR